jgi:hypothetical protein
MKFACFSSIPLIKIWRWLAALGPGSEKSTTSNGGVYHTWLSRAACQRPPHPNDGADAGALQRLQQSLLSGVAHAEDCDPHEHWGTVCLVMQAVDLAAHVPQHKLHASVCRHTPRSPPSKSNHATKKREGVKKSSSPCSIVFLLPLFPRPCFRKLRFCFGWWWPLRWRQPAAVTWRWA